MYRNLAIIIGITLMYASPLIYTALGGVISENAGVVNIGLEGMMTFGALIAATVGYYTGNPWLGFLAGGLAGMLLSLIHGIATINFAADHIISGIAINFIGPGLALFMARIFFKGATMTTPIPMDQKIPRSLNGFFAKNSIMEIAFNQYDTVYLAFVLVFVVWFILYKTKLGLRIRAVGEHPQAADSLGINVYKIKYTAVLISGLLAGFGGAAMSIAVVSNFRETLISGQGYIALAAMIFGKWKPHGALWACLLFGAAQGIAIHLAGTSIPVSSTVLNMLPYVITLLTLVVFAGKGGNGPAANGKPFEKN